MYIQHFLLHKIPKQDTSRSASFWWSKLIRIQMLYPRDESVLLMLMKMQQIKGESRISRKGVHIYIYKGVGFALLISIHFC